LNVTVNGSLIRRHSTLHEPRVFVTTSLTGERVLDDHVAFMRAGIPAVDLIDFEFGSKPGLNDYWHTDKDTLDKISPRSLEIVGKTTLRLIELLQNQATGH